MFWLILDSEKLLRVSSALLAPLIAIIAAWIALRQWRTHHLQYRLALFDKRLAVFNSTMKFMALVLQDARVELRDCIKFIAETREHEFLFGPEVGTFIDQVYKKGVELHTRLAVNPQGGPELTGILNWFSNQMGEARKKFKKYMDFTNP